MLNIKHWFSYTMPNFDFEIIYKNQTRTIVFWYTFCLFFKDRNRILQSLIKFKFIKYRSEIMQVLSKVLKKNQPKRLTLLCTLYSTHTDYLKPNGTVHCTRDCTLYTGLYHILFDYIPLYFKGSMVIKKIVDSPTQLSPSPSAVQGNQTGFHCAPPGKQARPTIQGILNKTFI